VKESQSINPAAGKGKRKKGARKKEARGARARAAVGER